MKSTEQVLFRFVNVFGKLSQCLFGSEIRNSSKSLLALGTDNNIGNPLNREIYNSELLCLTFLSTCKKILIDTCTEKYAST